jgi:hypothetical protein
MRCSTALMTVGVFAFFIRGIDEIGNLPVENLSALFVYRSTQFPFSCCHSDGKQQAYGSMVSLSVTTPLLSVDNDADDKDDDDDSNSSSQSSFSISGEERVRYGAGPSLLFPN